MPLGPVEVLVIAFPGNRFTGTIIPELERLAENSTIDIIDGLFVRKDADGELTFVELGELGGDHDAAPLADLLHQVEALVSDDDVAQLAADLELDSSAAILVFEHTWAKPLRDAVVSSGGLLAADFRVPGNVVDQLMADLAEMADAE